MAIFLRLLKENDKQSRLLSASTSYRKGEIVENSHNIAIDALKEIPGTPLAYWVSEQVLSAYRGPKYDNKDLGRCTRCGLGTLDDFRYIRTFWEVKSKGDTWVNYFHGGVFSRFYDNFPLLVKWGVQGVELKAFVTQKVGSASRKVQGEDKYFKEGFVFPRRTKGFSPKFMPRGGIFSTGGQAGFSSKSELGQTVALLASQACTFLISLSQGRTGDAAQYEVGLVKRLPWPDLKKYEGRLSSLAFRAWSLRRNLDTVNENSYAFILPFLLRQHGGKFSTSAIESELDAIQSEIDEIALSAYGFDATDCGGSEDFATEGSELISGDDEASEDTEEGSETDKRIISATSALYSWSVGVAFGRFDWRLATGERQPPSEPDPFEPLPAISAAMLQDGFEPFRIHGGILVDDPTHPQDLARLVELVHETVDAHFAENVRSWLQTDFFGYHLQRYSTRGRKAPIYWPLATASGIYTLWLYYPSLSNQTLFTAVNDFLDPKLKDVRDDLNALHSKGLNRNKQEEKVLEGLVNLEHELADLRDSLLEIAPNYRPNHDDGVQITAAPLWKLFRHKPWQKVLKDTWAKLEKGDYDWAHLAMNYWPDRVRKKCITDKSMAIAHSLEHLYIEPEPKPKKASSRKKAGSSE